MPHVVIAGDCDLRAFAAAFAGVSGRRGPDIWRADRVFADADGRTLLIDAVVIEAGRKQPFYIKVAQHDRGTVTVRIDPLTHPDRSDAVRALLADVAEALLAATPGARIERTNLVLESPGALRKEPSP